MSAHLFSRGLRRGWLNLRRGRGSLTSVAALFGVVFIAQMSLMLGLGAQGMQNTLAENNDFRLQLRLGVTDRDVQEFIVAVRQLPSVMEVEFVTREKAMEIERATHPEIVPMLESDAVNPFRDATIVTLGSLTEYDELAAFAQHSRWGRTVDPITFASMETRREELQSALRQAQSNSSAAFLLLGAAGLAILLTVLARVRGSATARSKDLFVERMSGEEEASIVLPFATEMAIQLVIALLLSIACITLILSVSPPVLPVLPSTALRAGGANVFAMAYDPALIVLEFAAVIFLGCTGAMLGIRRVHFSPHGSLTVI